MFTEKIWNTSGEWANSFVQVVERNNTYVVAGESDLSHTLILDDEYAMTTASIALKTDVLKAKVELGNRIVCPVSKDEVKRASGLDCGTDKDLGPAYRCVSRLVSIVDYWGRDCGFDGLHFQHDKSKLMGVLVDDEKVKQVASKLGCLILKPPFSYLGSKVGGSMHRIQAWNEVVDRVYARLSKWKMKTLSIGGRLESIRSYFFNGHDPNSKRTSWGGLMFKWVWRFFTQNTSLWSRVINAIHGEDGKVGKQVKSAFPSYWMDIVHEINVLKNQGINLLNCMQNEMGTTGIDKLLYGKTPLDWSYRS
ncbi:hypothetical protein Tco_0352018 [Tanacetum coccineum]